MRTSNRLDLPTRLALIATLGLGASVLASPASRAAAQEAPAVEQHTESVAEVSDEEVEDSTSWTLSAGGSFATGNTRARSLNAGTSFAARRGSLGVALQSAVGYGAVDGTDDGERNYVVNSRNINSRLRLDFFLSANDALFLALAHRWDEFAGIQSRLQLQAGYLRNFVNNDTTRLWSEIGIDYTWDNRIGRTPNGTRVICSPDQVATMFDGCGRVVENIQNIVAARLYLGFNHAFSDDVKLTSGVEFLANVNALGQEADAFEDIRINLDAALAAKLFENLALEIKFRMMFDNVPAATQEVDTVTVFSLVYTLI